MSSWFVHQQGGFVTPQCDPCPKDRLRGAALSNDGIELSLLREEQEEEMTAEVCSNLSVLVSLSSWIHLIYRLIVRMPHLLDPLGPNEHRNQGLSKTSARAILFIASPRNVEEPIKPKRVPQSVQLFGPPTLKRIASIGPT